MLRRTIAHGRVRRMLVKKYGNRRLYDTETSRYITINELTERIQRGAEATIVDAKTGDDLTQQTLTQVIIEGRKAGHLLPTALLHQLIRLGDDALAEFLGRYVTFALEMYLQAKQGAQAFNPFAGFNPFSPSSYFRGFTGGAPAAVPAPPAAPSADVESLKRELDALKKSLRKSKR
jgi:polyhydroxyalkanoate synthesis repressor PhaR